MLIPPSPTWSRYTEPSAGAVSAVSPSAPHKQLKCQAKPTQTRRRRVLSLECRAPSQRISSAGRKLYYLKAPACLSNVPQDLFHLSHLRCLPFYFCHSPVCHCFIHIFFTSFKIKRKYLLCCSSEKPDCVRVGR